MLNDLRQPQAMSEEKTNGVARPTRPASWVLAGRLPPLPAWFSFAAAVLMAVLLLVISSLGVYRLLPFVALLVATLCVNLGGAALVRRGLWPNGVNHAVRLSNLASCTLAILFFDGLYSPLIPLYTEDILSASLRDGKRGAQQSWRLVAVALVVVALGSWPLEGGDVTRLLVYVAVMGLVALFAGELGSQRIAVHAALARQTLENEQLYTELEERAQRLGEAYEEIKELDRSKTEFVQSVSHELRTPLSFIRGYIELLRDGGLGELSDLQREKLDIVAQRTILLADLVRDVASLQRGQPRPGEMAHVSLAELARQAVDSAGAMAHELGIALRLDLPAAPLNVWGSARQLEQVLTNLVGNALKFSPDGGVITVGARQEGEFVVVYVADEGIGVPPQEHERIFERFYQVDGSTTRFPGTGLGLTIVKEFVEGHGGRVWVQSPTLPGEPGHGSTFYFSIPLPQNSPRD
jgi:signal transduction histidine kinase